MTDRHRQEKGISLIEVLLAAILILAAAVPIVNALGSLRSSLNYCQRKTTAVLLGRAIVEHIQYRLYNEGLCAGAGTTNAGQRRQAIADFFDTLHEEGAAVVTTPETRNSRYFARVENLQRADLHGITADLYPVIFPRLRDFVCEIEASLDSPETDSDRDGLPEGDLCEVKVTLVWNERSGGPRRRLTLWTLVTARWQEDV